jgi:hypothetical protein
MAVINALGPLVKTRHTIAYKIINSLLSVDIVGASQRSADRAITQLQSRSLSKTLRIHLSHFLRTNIAGPLSNRIDQYLRTRLVNGVVLDGEEVSRKRHATDDFDQPSKKQKSEATAPAVVNPAISQAFMLDPTNAMGLFDAQQIPLSYVVQSILKMMEILPPQLLIDRLNVYPRNKLILGCPRTIINPPNRPLGNNERRFRRLRPRSITRTRYSP